MKTDTERCEILVRWMEVSCSPHDAGAAGLTQGEAKTMLDFVEACEAGYNLGLRGRELIDSAMNTVRFDEEPEKAREVTEQMVAERQDRERLDWLERQAPNVVEFFTIVDGEGNPGGLSCSFGYADSSGALTLREAIDDCMRAEDGHAAAAKVPEA